MQSSESSSHSALMQIASLSPRQCCAARNDDITKNFMTNFTKEQTEQELIDKYFERSLTPREEQEFHISLASNGSLRELFRAEVIVLQASAETASVIPAPEQFTRTLFSKLDLNIPVQQASPSRRLWPIALLALGSVSAGYFVNEWTHSVAPWEKTETLRHVESKQEEIVIQLPKEKTTTSSKTTVKNIPVHPATTVVEKDVTPRAETDKPIEIRLRPWKKDSLSQKP